MEEVSQDEWVKAKRRWSRAVGLAAWGFVGVFFVAVTGTILLFEVPFRLLCGWAVHAWGTLPPLLPRFNELLLPLAALALAMWLADRFVRWALAAKGSKLAWKGRHTVAATFLLLLGAAAAIAMSGIVHQVVWLVGETWWGNGRGFHQTIAISKARQIVLAIQDFEQKNGRYPESLAELDLPTELLLVPSRERGLAEPFVYLKPPDPLPAGEEVAVIVSPVLPDLDRVAVGYLSGMATTVPAVQLSGILDASHSQSSADHD